MPCPKPSGRNADLLEAAVNVGCWWHESGPVGQTELLPHMDGGEEKLRELRRQSEQMCDSKSYGLLDCWCSNPTKHFLHVKKGKKEKTNKDPSIGEVAECLDTFVSLRVLQMAPFTVRVQSSI